MTFIAAHHLGNADAVLARQAQQVGAAAERQRQAGGIRGDDLVLGTVGEDRLADHEAAAHRVVGGLVHLNAGGVEGGETQAVGMQRQSLAEHLQVGLLVEGDGVLAGQDDALVAADGLDVAGHLIHVDGVRLVAAEAEQHRLVTAVALAGGAQRAIQLGGDTGHLRHVAVVFQGVGEQRGRAHRADGVGAGGADTDFEQVENADSHGEILLVD